MSDFLLPLAQPYTESIYIYIAVSRASAGNFGGLIPGKLDATVLQQSTRCLVICKKGWTKLMCYMLSSKYLKK